MILVSTHAEEDLAELVDESPAIGFLPKPSLSAAAIRGCSTSRALPGLEERDDREHAAVVVVGLGQAELREDAADVLLDRALGDPEPRAMPAFERPSAISASTSRSRGVSTSSGSSTRARRDELLDERRVDHRCRPRRSARACR